MKPAHLLMSLVLLHGGCVVDEVRWRVRDPAAVALVRAEPKQSAQAGAEILPADGAPRSALVSYTRREHRGLSVLTEPCREGAADTASKFLYTAGGPYECRASAVAQRMPDGGLGLTLDGRVQPLLSADGTFSVPLWDQQYDPASGEALVHLGSPLYGFQTTWTPGLQPPRGRSFRNDLNLVVKTPGTNLVEAVRMKRPVWNVGWMLVGMSAGWFSAGGTAMGISQAAQRDGATFVTLGASCLGVGVVLLGLGVAVLTRPQEDVPLGQ